MRSTLVLLCLISSVTMSAENPDSYGPKGPPRGNGQYFTGMGLTIAGGPFALSGLMGLAGRLFIDTDNPYDIYGDPADEDDDEVFRRLNLGFGITFLAFSVAMESVGIPLLIKGKRMRAIRREWVESQKSSLQLRIEPLGTGARVVLAF